MLAEDMDEMVFQWYVEDIVQNEVDYSLISELCLEMVMSDRRKKIWSIIEAVEASGYFCLDSIVKIGEMFFSSGFVIKVMERRPDRLAVLLENQIYMSGYCEWSEVCTNRLSKEYSLWDENTKGMVKEYILDYMLQFIPSDDEDFLVERFDVEDLIIGYLKYSNENELSEWENLMIVLPESLLGSLFDYIDIYSAELEKTRIFEALARSEVICAFAFKNEIEKILQYANIELMVKKYPNLFI